MIIETYYRETETILPIERNKVNEDNVQYYCRHTRELEHTQVSKALKFVHYDCIKYIKDLIPEESLHSFICLPLNTKESHSFGNLTITKTPYLKDYNNSEYMMYKENGVWTCSCQGYMSKKERGEITGEGICCSHLLALFYCFKIRRFTKNHGITTEEEQIEDTLLESDNKILNRSLI